jgi:hypothetical protein
MRRTTLILDEDLIAEARAALNAKTVTETIPLALARVIRDQRLRDFSGQTFLDLSPGLIDQLSGRTPPPGNDRFV